MAKIVHKGTHCESCIEKAKQGGFCPKCGTQLPFPPLMFGNRKYFFIELAEKGAPAQIIFEKLEGAGIKNILFLPWPARDLKLPVPSGITAVVVAQIEAHLASNAGLGAWFF